MPAFLQKIFDTLKLVISFNNRKNSPSNKATVKNSSVGSFQQAGGDIHNITIADGARSRTRPRIDLAEYGGAGGADGTFAIFKLKNDGSEAAIDVRVEFVADDFRGGTFTVASLSPNEPSHTMSYKYDNTDFHKRLLKNPRIIFRYKSADGRTFVAGRTLIQEQRATGVYDIHKTEGTYFEREENDELRIEAEIDKVVFNKIVTTAEGLAESFTLIVPVLIKNPSENKIRIRNIRPTIELPSGYQWHMFYEDLNSPGGRDINGRDFLGCKFGFAANIIGREKGVKETNTEFVGNRDRILSEIPSAKILFHFAAEAMSLEGTTTISEEYDLTDTLLPLIKISK